LRQIVREQVFQIVCEEIFRKGYVAEGENDALVRLTKFFRLDPATAKDIARTARHRMAAESRASAAGPTPVRLYWRVLEHLHAQGFDATAEQILHALRVLFRIPDEVHADLRKQLVPEPAPVARAAAKPAETQTRLPRPVVRAEAEPAVATHTKLARPAEVVATQAAAVQELAAVPTPEEQASKALDAAAKLAREWNVDGAMKALEPALKLRPPPEGFEIAYQSVLRALVEDAKGTQSVDAVLAVVEWSAKVAGAPTGDAYRWNALVETVHLCGKVLADWGRWAEHQKLLGELDRMTNEHAAATPTFRARALHEAVRRCVAGGQYDQAWEFYRGFSKCLAWMSVDEVRTEYSAAQAVLIEFIVGHRDGERDPFLQLINGLQGLLKNHEKDRRVARSFTAAAASIGIMLLKLDDASAAKGFLGSVVDVVRWFPGDEDVALSFAKALLNTAMVWKELSRQKEAAKSFFVKMREKFSPKPDPIIIDLVTAMTVVVASVPMSETMSDMRKRFEGLTGAKLLSTKMPERPRSTSKLALKAAR
jgi:hypothetical protein